MRPDIVSALCFVAVGITSLFNLVLGLYCWGVLEWAFGSHFADNNGGLLLLLVPAVQVGLYTLFWLPAYYFSRKQSAGDRSRLFIAVTTLFLAFWFGWNMLVTAA